MTQLIATCPQCQVKLKYRHARTEIGCPRCHTRFQITAQAGASASPLPAVLKTPAAQRAPQPRKSTAAKPRKGSRLTTVLTLGLIATAVTLTVVLINVGIGEKASQTSGDANGGDGSTLVSTAPRGAIDTTPQMAYRWQIGQTFTYDFKFSALAPEGTYTLRGYCDYRVSHMIEPEDIEEIRNGTGTAFVVAENGYLVTCAHVVQDAEEISVSLGQEKFPAEVVAYDPVQDLALLKIQTDHLTALPLAGAEGLQLAEQVRVVGYPMTDMFGKGVKITSGSVAGLTEKAEDGSRRFQVDATVNPGNSGGPVVDEQGRVVGVASALISGFRMSEVGVAIPSDEITAMLAKAGIRATGAVGVLPTNGPELAKRVVPSVGFVEVRLADAAVCDYRVKFNCRVTATDFEPSGRGSRAQAEYNAAQVMGFPTDSGGWLTVNRVGAISHFEGGSSLPFSYDLLGRLIFESLDNNGESSWASYGRSALVLEELVDPTTHQSETSSDNVLPAGFVAFSSQRELQEFVELEQNEYKIGFEDAESIRIEKEHEYRTIEDDDSPKFKQEGTGKIIFDKKLRLPALVEVEAVAEERLTADAVSKVPFILVYELQKETVRQLGEKSTFFADMFFEIGRKIARDTEIDAGPLYTQFDVNPYRQPVTSLGGPTSRAEQGITVPATPSAGGHDNNGQFSEVLNPNQLREPANQPIDESNREQVAAQLMIYATNGDSDERTEALRALSRWDTSTQVSVLAELLRTDDNGLDWRQRGALIELLGNFPSSEVYAVLASCLAKTPDNLSASRVLIGFGSSAEGAVIAILKHPDTNARREAAQVLREIGTNACLEQLREAMNQETDFVTQHYMARTIERVERR